MNSVIMGLLILIGFLVVGAGLGLWLFWRWIWVKPPWVSSPDYFGHARLGDWSKEEK